MGTGEQGRAGSGLQRGGRGRGPARFLWGDRGWTSSVLGAGRLAAAPPACRPSTPRGRRVQTLQAGA